MSCNVNRKEVRKEVSNEQLVFLLYCNSFLQGRKATIPDKIFGTKWNNPIKLNRGIKLWYLFLRVFFYCYWQSLSS